MAVPSRHNRDLPEGDIRARVKKARRLQKSRIVSEKRGLFLFGSRYLSVPGRKPVRLSYKGNTKGKISALERAQLRKTMDRAIRRAQQDADDLEKAIEAGKRTRKATLPPDMIDHAANWFGIRANQIRIEHLQEMHRSMSNLARILKHPKFEIKIKENAQGNEVEKKLLKDDPSEKFSIELTRGNAFSEKHGMRALIMAAGIAGADLCDDRQALQYGTPGRFDHESFKASAYARFCDSRQTAYERNWEIERQRAEQKRQYLILNDRISDLYWEAPPSEFHMRTNEIAQAIWKGIEDRPEIRQPAPDVQALLRTVNSGTKPRSQAECETLVQTWLKVASGEKPALAKPPLKIERAPSPPVKERPEPSAIQFQVEAFLRENRDLLERVGERLPQEELRRISDMLKREIGEALKRAEPPAPVTQEDLTKVALPGSSFGTSPEDHVDHDEVAGQMSKEDDWLIDFEKDEKAEEEKSGTGALRTRDSSTKLAERNREDDRLSRHSLH